MLGVGSSCVAPKVGPMTASLDELKQASGGWIPPQIICTPNLPTHIIPTKIA